MVNYCIRIQAHLYANVMYSPVCVLGEKSRDGRLLPQRMEQLDLGVVQVDEDDRHAVGGEVLGSTEMSIGIERNAQLFRGGERSLWLSRVGTNALVAL